MLRCSSIFHVVWNFAKRETSTGTSSMLGAMDLQPGRET
jgi:hypothetical protein